VFHGCPEAAVVVGYFSKGLGAAVDLGVTKIIKELLKCLLDQDEELPKAAEVIVYRELDDGQLQHVLLQLCKWHAVSDIKRRLVAAGGYNKERRDELISMI
jgi:hypothetical protein